MTLYVTTEAYQKPFECKGTNWRFWFRGGFVALTQWAHICQ